MESDEAAFNELSRRIGRFFVAWAFLESSVNLTIDAIIEDYVKPLPGFDKPRNFSKKTEFIRRFFHEHKEWQFLDQTIKSLTANLDRLADARHALAHGLMESVAAAMAGPDVVMLLTKRSKGKEKLFRYTFTHEALVVLADRTFVHSVFVAHLSEVVSGELDDNKLQQLIGEIVSQAGAPLPVADPATKGGE